MRVTTVIVFALVLLGMASAQQSQPDMLRAWLRKIASEHLAARRAEVAEIRTAEQFEKRQGEVRAKILRLIVERMDGDKP